MPQAYTYLPSVKPVRDNRLIYIPGLSGVPELRADFVAGETLNGQRLLMVRDGKAWHFDPTDEQNAGKAIGLARTAANEGAYVVALRSGFLPGMSLEPGAVYYAGPNGTITTSIPASGILMRVGVARDAETLVIELSEPILMIN